MRTALGFLLLLCAAAAQTPVKARVEGRLENALTGEPLSRGSIRLQPAASLFRGPQYVVESDAKGNFVFDQIDPGTYVLFADQTGFLRGNYGARFLPNGEPIRLRAGDRKLVRLPLTPRSAISGRVLDGEGDPLPALEVEAWRWRWSESAGRRLLQRAARVTPDEEGNFRLATLPSGQYYLSASKLSPPGIHRRIPDEKEAEVFATTFYPGVLNLDEAQAVEVAVGEEVGGLNLRIRRLKLAKIRGTIANHYSFRPLNLMALELTPLARSAEAFPGAVRSVTVTDGSFEFLSVAPGRYSITARDNSPAEHLAARTDVVVAEKDLDNVHVELLAGADIKCTVRVERPRAEVHDHPEGDRQDSAVKATVMLRNAEGGVSTVIMATQETPGGPLSLRDIPPGRYWVDVTNLPRDFYVKWIRFGEQDATAAPLKVSQGGSEPQLDVMLSDKTATLSGVVTDANGGPVRIAQVMLAPATPDLEKISRLVKGTVSGAGGTFRFEGVAPGQYVVLAFEDAEPGLAADPEYRAGFAASTISVNLAPSADRTIEVHAVSGR